MRYELTDYEWTAIKPFLPNKPRGVPRVNDRRVLNGIFWVLRSGAPWRDLPDNFLAGGARDRSDAVVLDENFAGIALVVLAIPDLHILDQIRHVRVFCPEEP